MSNIKNKQHYVFQAYLKNWCNEDDKLWVFNKKDGKIFSSGTNNILNKRKRFLVLLFFLDVIGDVGLKLSLFLDLYPMEPKLQEDFLLDISDILLTNASETSWKNSEFKKIVLHSRFSRIIQNAIKKIPIAELETIIEDIFRRLNTMHHYQSRQGNNYYIMYYIQCYVQKM